MFCARLTAQFDSSLYPKYGMRWVLIYSKFVHERIHAERLGQMWVRNGTKPPMSDTDAIYENQYAEIPSHFTAPIIEIIDTKKDEVCYNGNPRYAAEYADIAAMIVGKYELDSPTGIWTTYTFDNPAPKSAKEVREIVQRFNDLREDAAVAYFTRQRELDRLEKEALRP
jgi:hypothetical protein